MHSRSPEGAAPGADVISDVSADARRYHTSVDLSNKNSSITQLILLTGRNKKVLEAGPATGYVTEALQARGCQVTAIERDPKAAELAARFCDRMLVGDIEEMDLASAFAGDQFDVVMFGDVLEHLVNPDAVLEKVRPLLRAGGYVVASIPNIAHASVRLMLLDGRFTYTDKGLLDHTHVRFFTKAGLETLFKEAEYSIRVWRRTLTETLKDPFAEEISLPESELPPYLVEALREDSEALTYQFVVRAYPRRARRSNRRKPQAHSASNEAIGGVFRALWQPEEKLGQKDQEIARMRSTLVENDASLATKDKALAAKDKALAAKDADLAEKNKELAQKEAHLRDIQMQLQAATSTLGYRLLERVRRGINRLAPLRTRRRVPLALARHALNIVLTEGPMTLLRRLPRIRRWAPRVWRNGASSSYDLPLNEQYQIWLRAHTITPGAKRAIKKAAKRLNYRPKVSIIMPVYNTDPRWLREALESVRQQLYDNWELCIADDGSSRGDNREVLQEYQRRDGKIKVKYLDRNQGIAAASNAALSLATGEFIGLLDHDDELKPDALFEVVKLLNERRDLDYIYSDEDKKELDGRLVEPFFKPDWSLALLLSLNYVTHFSVFRKEIVDSLGGFRLGYDGSQDYDLILRVTEITDRIAHIPKPLYTWRKVPGSAAASPEAKEFAYPAAKRAIKDALTRHGVKAEVQDGPFKGYYRVRYAITGKPRVAIIIPTRDRADMLRRCIESIRGKSSYRNFDIVVIDNDSREPETLEYLSSFPGRVIRYPHEFNFARMMNEAAKQVECDAFLFLNNDTEVISSEWIEAMLEHGMQPEVGAVGARLLFPNGQPQHEGVLIGPGDGLAGNLDHRGYFGLGQVIRNCSAVTAACMLTRPSVFWELGGFDEELKVAYSDVDLCLRARQKGYLIVYTPYALLYHDEGGTRGRIGRTHPLEDEETFRLRWSERGQYRDPYYNPNLDLTYPFTIRI